MAYVKELTFSLIEVAKEIFFRERIILLEDLEVFKFAEAQVDVGF